jgi:hypothetical protein
MPIRAGPRRGDRDEGAEIGTNSGDVLGAVDRARPRPRLLLGLADGPARSRCGGGRCLGVRLVPFVQILGALVAHS